MLIIDIHKNGSYMTLSVRFLSPPRLNFDKYALSLWVNSFDRPVQSCHGYLNRCRQDRANKIDADVHDNKVRPHVHGQYSLTCLISLYEQAISRIQMNPYLYEWPEHSPAGLSIWRIPKHHDPNPGCSSPVNLSGFRSSSVMTWAPNSRITAITSMLRRDTTVVAMEL